MLVNDDVYSVGEPSMFESGLWLYLDLSASNSHCSLIVHSFCECSAPQRE